MINNKYINKYMLNNKFYIYKIDKFKNNLIIILKILKKKVIAVWQKLLYIYLKESLIKYFRI